MQDVMNVNQKEYKIVKLLGHGKGGYSYLAEREGKFYVLKQIHHEPCEYYSFGNKIEAEQNDYNRLLQTGKESIMKNNYTQGEGKDGNNPHSRDAYAACRI